MSRLDLLRKELHSLGTEKKAKASTWFFKTKEGQYGFGDKFIGVTVPEQRVIAKKYKDLDLYNLEILLSSDIHEERLTALLILVGQFQKADELRREELFKFYIMHLKGVNNWDLVDSSADKIIGEYLLDKKITLLLSFAKSESLWERRIGIVATFAFLKNNNAKPTYLISDLLLSDRDDLIQKAVGWMLRESGKKVSEKGLEEYLKKNYKRMGRTTLRYAIERFDEDKRKEYLSGAV